MDKSATQWMVEPLRKYLTFAGRARRKEFWWFWLFSYGIGLIVSVVASAIQRIEDVPVGWSSWVRTIVWLAFFPPSFAVIVRRLHDMAHSGWWLLLLAVAWLPALFIMMVAILNDAPDRDGSLQLVNIVIGLVLVPHVALLLLCSRRGTIGQNRFGPDPISE